MPRVDVFLRVAQDIIVLATMVFFLLGLMPFENTLVLFGFFATLAVLNIQRGQENAEAAAKVRVSTTGIRFPVAQSR